MEHSHESAALVLSYGTVLVVVHFTPIFPTKISTLASYLTSPCASPTPVRVFGLDNRGTVVIRFEAAQPQGIVSATEISSLLSVAMNGVGFPSTTWRTTHARNEARSTTSRSASPANSMGVDACRTSFRPIGAVLHSKPPLMDFIEGEQYC